MCPHLYPDPSIPGSSTDSFSYFRLISSPHPFTRTRNMNVSLAKPGPAPAAGGCLSVCLSLLLGSLVSSKRTGNGETADCRCLVSLSPFGDRKIQISQEQSSAPVGRCKGSYRGTQRFKAAAFLHKHRAQHLTRFSWKPKMITRASNPHRRGWKLRRGSMGKPQSM